MSNPLQPEPAATAAPEEERDDAVIGRAFRWSLASLACAGVVVGALYLLLAAGETPSDVRETPLALAAVRERPQAALPEARWTDITSQAGIRFVHQNGAAGQKLLPETMGGGCAFLDFDADGDQDLLLVNSSRWPWDPPLDPPATMALYRNDGSGRFMDVTPGSGLDISFYGQGVAVGDYDNDGDADVFISAVGPDRLLRNSGGRFEDVTQAARIIADENEWGTSCGWLDYDRDGDLDLFVCNYLRWSKDSDAGLNCTLEGTARAYCRPELFEGTFPYLYRNDAGKFTEVAQQAGLHVRNPATGVPMAKSLGVSPVDLDRDGWIDLVVANDTVQNFVFHNQRNGTFREIGAISGVAFDSGGNARGAMGIDTARFRNDDAMGIAIGNFANEMTALYVSSKGDLQFSDEAIATGLGPATRLQLTFGLFFFDFDLDGRLDLLAANGHLEEDIQKVQESQRYQQPPQLFWNAGPNHGTEFLPVPEAKCGADFCRPLVGRGATFADIDADGDLDVLLTASGARPRLLRNDQTTGHHWLRVTLVGGRSNRDAIGATVEVQAGGTSQWQAVMPTRSYLSQSELPVTFGLGAATRVERVIVHWPSGRVRQIPGVSIDTMITVHEPAGG